MSQLIALMVAIFLPAVLSYREFLSLLPNGQNVPDPCNPGTVWEGVGHLVKEGKSKRNAFGKDFHKYGKMWSKELCLKDSDGDGKTNGVELGDPDCTWTPGSLPKGPSLSHPGICEPLESEQCKTVNSWLNCNIAANYEMGQFCPHINNKTITRDLRLSPTLVPEKETTYYCQLFDLRLTSDHHMVATQPLITTKLVVHHVLLFGCNPRESLENVTRSPYLCDMVPHTHCNSLIGAWTIGSPGECAHPEMGFRIGPKGYKTVALQVHWNNAHLNSSITDNSGLRIYLTSALRKHDAGMLVIGQNFLQIDPAQDGDDSGITT
ncbi:tyramine beta-hydroxylase [Biomphalaria glabrata]